MPSIYSNRGTSHLATYITVSIIHLYVMLYMTDQYFLLIAIMFHFFASLFLVFTFYLIVI
jgi:hypothetical protein